MVHPATPEAMLDLLFAWARAGWIRELDAALAHRLADLAPRAPADCLLAVALVSQQAGQGHLLLDLELARRSPQSLQLQPLQAGAQRDESWPTPQAVLLALSPDWAGRLRAWEAVGEGPGAEPLVLEAGCLYLRRYWRYEMTVSDAIARRLAQDVDAPAESLRPLLQRLFPDFAPGAPGRWQALACALGARGAFTVITGGPGTGKTTTVVRLLALLQGLALQRGAALRIRLAAPTGKAAARLAAAIGAQRAALPDLDLPEGDDLGRHIPAQVTTLHRLLGARADTRHFRHHRLRPLPLDVLVVDEASMVDIEMMAALLEALPPSARLILLGDRDQLASVEAGAVLGSLCARADEGHYHPELAAWLERVSAQPVGDALIDRDGEALDQAVAMLRHSYRFAEGSGIGELAAAVNAGDGAAALRVLDSTARPEVGRVRLRGAALSGLTRTVIDGAGHAAAPGYRAYLEAMSGSASGEDASVPTRPAPDADRESWDRWATAILTLHARFQLLTPLREGPCGVPALNERIAAALDREGLIARPANGEWYAGRPVLVTGNDYGLGLMNGDVGIALRAPRDFADPDAGETLRVAFASGPDTLRWVLPSRLRHVETAYAMTVHKSQGSEFAHAALVLPEERAPVLTRELVYTAVTRAREAFTLLCADESVLAEAVSRRVARRSRLREAFIRNPADSG
jgi:exodeoxyribonuclease V alpha subunit